MRSARRSARNRLSGPTALLFEAVGLVGVSAILTIHGVRDLTQPSGDGAVLAWSGLGAVPVLWLVAALLAAGMRDARAEASDNARRLAGAEETGQELVWEIDPDGAITYMSGVAREMFGIGPAELIGQSVFVLLPPHEQARARTALAECVRDRRGWSGLTFEALHTGGTLRWIETTATAHLDHTGQVQGFTATTRRLDSEARQRIELDRLRSRVQHVLDSAALRSVFQPIVDVTSGRTVGYEALSRVDAEPSQPPDRWFTDADAVGLGVDLDCLAVAAALAAARRIPEHCYVSVNAAPSTLASGRLLAVIQAAPMPAGRVVIEVTEHVSVEDYESLHAPLQQLRELGVRIAVDDAGSGYASLRHILRLRPEFIKLDREIIRDIHLDPARRALASALVVFAREVGAKVIAEGIENTAELEMIARLGIESAQGFLLGRPDEDPLPGHGSPAQGGIALPRPHRH